MVPVSYREVLPKRKRKRESLEDDEIIIREGSRPEIYTEEHDKLLGDCKTSWTLFVDGYGEDGKRIYDGVKGETCHQCRFVFAFIYTANAYYDTIRITPFAIFLCVSAVALQNPAVYI